MESVFAKIGALGEAMFFSRRKSVRIPVHAEAKVVSSHGDSANMIIGNVSTHGCYIRGEASWLRIGSFVGVSLKGNPPLQAIVRWVRDDSAGLEFLRPVPGDNAAWQELINSISDM